MQIRITKASRAGRKALLSDPLPGPGAERRVVVGRPSVLGNPFQIGRDGRPHPGRSHLLQPRLRQPAGQQSRGALIWRLGVLSQPGSQVRCPLKVEQGFCQGFQLLQR